jgi:hypothetical protein
MHQMYTLSSSHEIQFIPCSSAAYLDIMGDPAPAAELIPALMGLLCGE